MFQQHFCTELRAECQCLSSGSQFFANRSHVQCLIRDGINTSTCAGYVHAPNWSERCRDFQMNNPVKCEQTSIFYVYKNFDSVLSAKVSIDLLNKRQPALYFPKRQSNLV